jgi:hypothetical protein
MGYSKNTNYLANYIFNYQRIGEFIMIHFEKDREKEYQTLTDGKTSVTDKLFYIIRRMKEYHKEKLDDVLITKEEEQYRVIIERV